MPPIADSTVCYRVMPYASPRSALGLHRKHSCYEDALLLDNTILTRAMIPAKTAA